MNPVPITSSSPEVEVEDRQLDRIEYASVTTDFHLLEKQARSQMSTAFVIGPNIGPFKHSSILGNFLQILF